MKRWLPLLLTLALALGCAGCARRQTVTVYRIAKEGAALMETETITARRPATARASTPCAGG